MTYDEIVKAIDSGKKVCWSHNGYEVIKDDKGSVNGYGILCHSNQYYTGLISEFFENGKLNLSNDVLAFFVVEE